MHSNFEPSQSYAQSYARDHTSFDDFLSHLKDQLICIQALKCRMQALFLMEIQNFKSDCKDFAFLLFLGIKSDSNQSTCTTSGTSWVNIFNEYFMHD